LEALGVVSAILGLITGISGLIREWKAGPTVVVASILIAGGVALFVVPTQSTGGEGGGSGSGGSGRSLETGGATPTPSPTPEPDPTPAPAPNPTPPVDPQSTEEYQVCVTYSGYGQWQCDPLLDEASGGSARADFRACVQNTQDAAGCVEAVYTKYGGY
jgi:hypothetical protein